MTMSNIEHPYWFPAKRYGWGWGVPNTWQGWVVVAVFAALISVGVVCRGALGQWLFIAYASAVCLGLVVLAQRRAATLALGR